MADSFSPDGSSRIFWRMTKSLNSYHDIFTGHQQYWREWQEPNFLRLVPLKLFLLPRVIAQQPDPELHP